MNIGILTRGDREVVLLAVLAMFVLALGLWSKGLLEFSLQSYLGNAVVFSLAGIPFLAVFVFKTVVLGRPESPLRSIIDAFASAEWRCRSFGALAIIVSLISFMPLFSSMKSSVPLFNAYSWDAYFIDLDRQIHGRDPWALLQPVLGYPFVTSVLSAFYHFWLVLLYIVALFFALRTKQPEVRQRYFMSYFILWPLLGVGLAIAFASVGPCFVEPILGRNEFVPLMDYLRSANEHYPVHVLRVQEMLLQGYKQSDNGLGRGITAMPSMHVSQALLFFLAMRHVSGIAAWLFGSFFFLILIGSVHLAYHYAVDGYVAIAITALVWKLSGWWVSRDGKPASAGSTG